MSHISHLIEDLSAQATAAFQELDELDSKMTIPMNFGQEVWSDPVMLEYNFLNNLTPEERREWQRFIHNKQKAIIDYREVGDLLENLELLHTRLTKVNDRVTILYAELPDNAPHKIHKRFKRLFRKMVLLSDKCNYTADQLSKKLDEIQEIFPDIYSSQSLIEQHEKSILNGK